MVQIHCRPAALLTHVRWRPSRTPLDIPKERFGVGRSQQCGAPPPSLDAAQATSSRPGRGYGPARAIDTERPLDTDEEPRPTA
jgi:hypothetical protein